MFIKDATFNKWCKNAHNMGNLVVGKIGWQYLILGDTFNILIEEDSITNKQKAIIVTYSGELPKEGEVWNTKDKNYKFDKWERLFDDAGGEEIYKSWMILEPKPDSGVRFRVYMDEYERPVCAVHEAITEEITDTATQANEDAPMMPVLKEHMVIWRNSCMILSTYTSEREDVKKLMNRMEKFIAAEKEALIRED